MIDPEILESIHRLFLRDGTVDERIVVVGVPSHAMFFLSRSPESKREQIQVCIEAGKGMADRLTEVHRALWVKTFRHDNETQVVVSQYNRGDKVTEKYSYALDGDALVMREHLTHPAAQSALAILIATYIAQRGVLYN